MKKQIAAGLSLAIIFSAGAVWAEESEEHDTTITQEQLPAAVKDTVKEYGMGGEFDHAMKTDEDGVAVYEVTLKKDGKDIQVQTTMDGDLNMREMVVENSALPSAAHKRVMKESPGAKVTRVEKTLRSVYEVMVTDASGKKHEVLVTPGGQLAQEPEELDSKEGKEESDEKEEKEESAKKAGKHESKGKESGAAKEKASKKEKGEEKD